MTNLSRLSNAALADQLGALKAEQAELAKREKALKAMLFTRMETSSTDRISGELFDVQRIEARRATLDAKLIREMFAATGARVPEKVSWVTRWDVKARVAEAA